MSTADLKQLAAEIERAGHEAHAAGDLEWALRCFTWALRLGKELDPAEARALLAEPKARTLIAQMAHAETVPEARRRGRPTKTHHPFPAALEAKGLTVAEWARKHDVEREVVKSWFAPGKSGRRIPSKWATVVQRELGLPATDATWPNGIR